MGSTCRPYPIAHCAGKGPLHMAEDFALHQLLGNSCTVERHKLLLLTTTQAMNGLGTHFLAGTTLTGDEDGGPGRSRRFYDAVDLLHGQRGADKPLEALALDRVMLLPAGDPPHKHATSMYERLEMCRLAALGQDGLFVSDAEVLRDGVTYTADTLSVFHRDRPDVDWYYIIGADTLGYLSTEHVVRLAKGAKCGFCTACFTGEYAVKPEEVLSTDIHERHLNDRPKDAKKLGE